MVGGVGADAGIQGGGDDGTIESGGANVAIRGGGDDGAIGGGGAYGGSRGVVEGTVFLLGYICHR